jgi:hypothetical protein
VTRPEPAFAWGLACQKPARPASGLKWSPGLRVGAGRPAEPGAGPQRAMAAPLCTPTIMMPSEPSALVHCGAPATGGPRDHAARGDRHSDSEATSLSGSARERGGRRRLQVGPAGRGACTRFSSLEWSTLPVPSEARAALSGPSAASSSPRVHRRSQVRSGHGLRAYNVVTFNSVLFIFRFRRTHRTVSASADHEESGMQRPAA